MLSSLRPSLLWLSWIQVLLAEVEELAPKPQSICGDAKTRIQLSHSEVRGSLFTGFDRYACMCIYIYINKTVYTCCYTL